MWDLLSKGAILNTGGSSESSFSPMIMIVVVILVLFGFGKNGLGGAESTVGTAGTVAEAQFVELNGQLNAVRQDIAHSSDISELRALGEKQCETEKLVLEGNWKTLREIDQTRFDALKESKESEISAIHSEERILGAFRGESERTRAELEAFRREVEALDRHKLELEISELKNERVNGRQTVAIESSFARLLDKFDQRLSECPKPAYPVGYPNQPLVRTVPVFPNRETVRISEDFNYGVI
jgi:hypothetical protein